MDIRRARPDDLSGIVELHERAFGVDPVHRVHLFDIYRTALFEHPWHDDAVRPLLARRPDGKVAGFIGVTPRPFVHRGRRVTGAVAFSFMTDGSDPFLAFRLVKELFSGPQAFTLSDGANRISVELWTRLGAQVVAGRSTKWTHPFRPCELAVRHWSRSRGCSAPPPAIRLACRGIDGALSRLPWLRPAGGESLVERPATPGELAAHIAAATRRRVLGPAYSAEDLGWLLAAADRLDPARSVRSGIVTDAGEDPIGWYVSLWARGEIEEVLHLGTTRPDAGPLLRHLLGRSHRSGASALQIRVDPAHLGDFWEAPGILRRAPVVLVHASDPSTAADVASNEALLGLLEGEQWMRFPPARRTLP